MNVKGVVLVYVFAWLVGTFSVQANMSDDSVVVYERSSNYFFSSDETIEIIVRCDVDELLSDISDKRDWHLGKLPIGKMALRNIAAYDCVHAEISAANAQPVHSLPLNSIFQKKQLPQLFSIT